MMTRELVPPTMAPGHQPRQEGSRCGKTHRGDYPEPEANYGDRTGESPYAKQECSGPGHGHVLQPQSGRAAGQDDDEREGTEQRHGRLQERRGDELEHGSGQDPGTHQPEHVGDTGARENELTRRPQQQDGGHDLEHLGNGFHIPSPDRLGTPGSPFQQSAVLKHRFGSGRFVASLDCGR